MELDWIRLAKLDVIFGILGGVLFVFSGIYWTVRIIGIGRITALIAWALVGEEDEEKLFLTIGYVVKWIVALIIWATIGASVSLILLFFSVMIFNIPGVPASGESLGHFVAICATIGAFSRICWPLAKRLHSQLQQHRSEGN